MRGRDQETGSREQRIERRDYGLGIRKEERGWKKLARIEK
jgi:hypothetical protein